jgi:hypothetical protein
MKFLLLITLTSLLLAGCSQNNTSLIESTKQIVQIHEVDPAAANTLIPESPPEADELVLESTTDAAANSDHWPDGEEKLDIQGAVETTVIPLNLNSPAESLNFEVTLNTHSVDLSMDLASLATLEADNGLTVSASEWEAPSGGHHVGGVLSFPTEFNGSALLENASRVTLIIRDVDAPVRAFSWIASE